MPRATGVWVLAALACGLVEAAAGVSSIEVGPLTCELQVAPGRAHTNTLKVTNAGERAEHIRAFCEDWTLKPDGVVVFAAPGKLPDSASGWMQLSPVEFDLEPGASQQVKYTLRVPMEATGEARTVVIFEAAAQMLSVEGAPSRLVPRVGTIFYVQCGPRGPAEAVVRGFEIGPAGGKLVVENRGGSHLRFRGRLEVRSDGRLVRASELNSFVVLPPPYNTRVVQISGETFAGLPDGSYEAVVVLDYGGPALLGARARLEMAAAGAAGER